MDFYINQSTIKKFIKKGTEIPHCPNKIHKSYIIREFPDPTSEAMLKGKYFESEFIGGTAHGGGIVADLPRKRVTKKALKLNPNAIGEKTLSQIRIDEQVKIGKEKAKKYGVVYNEFNTQTKIYKRWHEDPNIILTGELDIFPTILKYKGNYYLTIVDLKLTADISNTYGDFCWGDFESMDHLQSAHYQYLIKDIDFDLNDELNPGNYLRELINPERAKMINDGYLLFVYWIFDYKPKYNDMFQPHIMHPIDWAHYYETIRKSISMLGFMESQNWPCNPGSLCEGCNVKTCEYYNQQFR